MRIITAFFIIFSILYSTEIKSADYALISDIGSSAQSIALGNIEGFSDSSTAVFDNPAGLYRTTGYSISLFTTQLMSDVHYYNVSLCGETPFGKVGVGVYEAHVNNLYTTALRDDADESIYEDTAFDYKNSILKLSYQTSLSSRTHVGGSYSLYNQAFYSISGTGVSMDLGLIHLFDQYSLSVFAQNILPNSYVAYSNKKYERIPFFISTTLNIPYRDMIFIPQLKSGQDHILTSFGFQYSPYFLPFVDLLAGYKEQLDYTRDKHRKLTIGFGLRLIGTNIYYAYERSDYFLTDHHSYLSMNYNL